MKEQTKNLEQIKEELMNISNTIVRKATERSIKDVSVSTEGITFKEHNGIKKAVVDFEKDKVTLTLYRSYVNEVMRKVLGMNNTQQNELLSFVEEMKLYQAYNLFVSSVMRNEKSVFLG